MVPSTSARNCGCSFSHASRARQSNVSHDETRSRRYADGHARRRPAGRVVEEARARQAVAQVVENRLRDVDRRTVGRSWAHRRSTLRHPGAGRAIVRGSQPTRRPATADGTASTRRAPWQPSPGPTTCRVRVRRREPAGCAVRRVRPVRRRDARGRGGRRGHRRAVAPRRRGYFRVNGVDVIPFVEAELDRRFPGRARATRGRPGRPARGVGGAGAHLGGDARPRLGDARRHGRRLGGRRVVVRADAAAPGPGHGHVAGQGDPAARAAVPPARSAGRGGDGRRRGPVGLHDGDADVRRGPRGPGGSGRDGARPPRRRSPPTSSTRRAGTRTPPSTRRPSAPACT